MQSEGYTFMSFQGRSLLDLVGLFFGLMFPRNYNSAKDQMAPPSEMDVIRPGFGIGKALPEPDQSNFFWLLWQLTANYETKYIP
jgi:hypothetical protein